MKRDPTTRALFRAMDEKIRAHLYRGVEFLALRGLHAKAIASLMGMTPSQIYQACGHMKIRLRDYRDGLGPVGSKVASQGRQIGRGKHGKQETRPTGTGR